MKKIILIGLSLMLAACSGGSGPAKSLDQSSLDPQPGVIYYIDDHLGSSNILTDSQGTVLHEESRYPFGIERGSKGEAASGDYAYTGKEFDAETGLVYFGGRYYSSTLARWITPDPLFLEKPTITTKRPLEGNLYSYVSNNPIRNVDPAGNFAWDVTIDVGFFVYGMKEYLRNPNMENGINLVLDTAGLIPAVPALGAIKRGLFQGGKFLKSPATKQLANATDDLFQATLKRVDSLDFRTPTNKAVFYSGPGQYAKATDFANKTGSMTIEMTKGGKQLITDPIFQKLSRSQQYDVWQKASKPFAEGASGKINAFINGARDTGTFRLIEEPALKANKHVFQSTYCY